MRRKFLIFCYHCYRRSATISDLYILVFTRTETYKQKNELKRGSCSDIVLITSWEYYHILSSFPLQLPTLSALRFSRTPRLDIKSKRAHLTFLPSQSPFIRQQAGIARIYVCIPPDFSCVPAVFQYSLQYRDAANCWPASLFPSCKCVHVGSSCAHSKRFYGTLHRWSTNDRQSRQPHIMSFAFFLHFTFLCKKKEREIILWNVTLQYYITTFITDIDTYATYLFINYTCNSRLLLMILLIVFII